MRSVVPRTETAEENRSSRARANILLIRQLGVLAEEWHRLRKPGVLWAIGRRMTSLFLETVMGGLACCGFWEAAFGKLVWRPRRLQDNFTCFTAHCHHQSHGSLSSRSSHHQLLILISKGEHLVDQTSASPHQRMISLYLKESSPKDHKSRLQRMTPIWKASAPIVNYEASRCNAAERESGDQMTLWFGRKNHLWSLILVPQNLTSTIFPMFKKDPGQEQELITIRKIIQRHRCTLPRGSRPGTELFLPSCKPTKP